jgi:hypothetical protein
MFGSEKKSLLFTFLCPHCFHLLVFSSATIVI